MALKSMRLTLAANDALHDRVDAKAPQCGWSSTIYGTDPGERLSLMINQAMIAKALTQSCKALGGLCAQELADEIAGTNTCLIRKFERDFDAVHGLYRINGDIDFRFAGKLAPWNWQVTFAGILDASAEPEMQQRAANMVRTFLDEWERDENGGLWRYWPEGYYLEKGLTPQQTSRTEIRRHGSCGHHPSDAERFCVRLDGRNFGVRGETARFSADLWHRSAPRSGRERATGRALVSGQWLEPLRVTGVQGRLFSSCSRSSIRRHALCLYAVV